MEILNISNDVTSSFTRKKYQKKSSSLKTSQGLIIKMNSDPELFSFRSDSLQNFTQPNTVLLNPSENPKNLQIYLSKTFEKSSYKDFFFEISKTHSDLVDGNSFENFFTNSDSKNTKRPENVKEAQKLLSNKRTIIRDLKINVVLSSNKNSQELTESINASNSSDSTPHLFTSYKERLTNLLLHNFP